MRISTATHEIFWALLGACLLATALVFYHAIEINSWQLWVIFGLGLAASAAITTSLILLRHQKEKPAAIITCMAIAISAPTMALFFSDIGLLSASGTFLVLLYIIHKTFEESSELSALVIAIGVGIVTFALSTIPWSGRIASVELEAAFTLLQQIVLIIGVILLYREVVFRRELNSSLSVSEARYRDLFNNANVMIQGVGLDGRFLFVNSFWQSRLGYTHQEAATMHFEEIIHPSELDHCRQAFLNIQIQEKQQSIRTTFVSSSGEAIYVSGSINAQFEDAQFIMTRGIFRDVTKQHIAEQHLRQQLIHTNALYSMAQSIISYEDLPHLLQNVVDSIAAVLNADRVMLYTFDGTRNEIIHHFKGGVGANRWRDFNYTELMDGLTGWVLTHQVPAFVKNGEEDPRVSEAVLASRIQLDVGSAIVVPIHFHETNLGVLAAINRRVQPDFGLSDVDLMMALSNQAAIALENVRLYEAEQKAAQDLAKQNEDLNRFAHTVAHELKTPLGHMVGFAEMLEIYSQGLSEADHDALATIIRSGHTMSTIIEELLLLAQVRQGEVAQSEIEMTAVVANAVVRLKPVIEAEKAQLILPNHWPPSVGHAPWIEEIWVNYMSNAIKYGGRPPLVELGYSELNGAEVLFWVRDNGAGLSAEEQAQLFVPFERLQTAKAPGHGLGLSIVKQIADKLGGRVGVESNPNRGALFYFTLAASRE